MSFGSTFAQHSFGPLLKGLEKAGLRSSDANLRLIFSSLTCCCSVQKEWKSNVLRMLLLCIQRARHRASEVSLEIVKWISVFPLQPLFQTNVGNGEKKSILWRDSQNTCFLRTQFILGGSDGHSTDNLQLDLVYPKFSKSFAQQNRVWWEAA